MIQKVIDKYGDMFPPETIEYDKDYSHLVHRGDSVASFKWNWVDFLTDKEKKE